MIYQNDHCRNTKLWFFRSISSVIKSSIIKNDGKNALFFHFFNILRLDNKNSQIQLSNKFITFLICYLSIIWCLNKYLRPWRGVSLITPSSACSPCPILFSNTALNHYFPKQFQEVFAVENFVITSLYVKHIAFFSFHEKSIH